MLRWKDKLISKNEGKSHLLKNTGAYLLLGLSVVAMTFFGICSPKGDYAGLGLSGSAAKVGPDRVTQQEFQRAYSTMRDRMQSQYQEAFDPVAMQLTKYVMRQLVDERVAYQSALSAGIEAQEDDVIALLKDAKAFQDDKGKFNTEAFERYLRGNGYTEASFSTEIRRSVTAQNFRQFVSRTAFVSSRAAALQYRLNETKIDVEFAKIEPAMIKLTISEEDITKFLDEPGKAKVKTYFDTHTSEFNTKERAKARHILVSYTGARNAAGAGALRTKDAAKKQAEGILKQVKAAGADFAKIATSSTDEASGKAKGGDLGLFSREDMVKEFSDAAFALAPGQISGVVESPFGFHVIKLEEKQTAAVTTLEQATRGIATKLLKEEKAPTILQAKADELLASIVAGKSIDAELHALGSKWESTGLQDPGSGSFGALGSDRVTLDAVGKLTKIGEVAPVVLTNRTTKLIAKLKARQVADETKLDDKKRKELAESAASSSGSTILSAYERSLRKDLEAKGKIWENPEYLSIGQRRDKDKDTGG